jgi:hypothetical protein
MSSNLENAPMLHMDIVYYPQEKTFVAECLQVPIIVEAETLDELKEKINLAVGVYFETFPDDHLNFTRIISIADRPVVQESGGRTLMVMPIPSH